MPTKTVKIVTLEANTALLCNVPGDPAATFNLTLNQAVTEGVCRPTSSGLNGTIDIDVTTSESLLCYKPSDKVSIQWSGAVFVDSVVFSAA